MEKYTYTFDELCQVIDEFSSTMDDYPYVMDIENDTYYISEKAMSRFAIPSNRFSDTWKVHKTFVYKEDFQMLMEDQQELLLGRKTSHDLDYRWIGKDGQPIWINCRGRVIESTDGSRFMIGCINEIGNQAKADNLSGLFQASYIQGMFDKDYQGKRPLSLLRIGIDDFKHVNEKFGTRYGDFIIKGVSDCIRRVITPQQKAVYINADEFMLVDFQDESADSITQTYNKLKKELENFIEMNRYEAVYTISGGLLYGKQLRGQDFMDVMKISEYALSEAKNRGKNQVYVFKHEDYDQFIRRRSLVVELRRAVANNFEGFDLYFQPIMTSTQEKGVLYAAESLCRFKKADGTPVSPAEFIPLLEESGLIIPVGRWILDRAAAMCKECQKYNPDFKVSINLSYVQIMKSAILNEIFNVVAKYSLKPSSLILEITESGYLDNTPSLRSIWNSLKKFGVLIAIDDFGTGYSNLMRISQFSPDIIKIDREFTIKALKNPYESRLMSNIIDLVQSIDLKICIEGVETREELNILNLMNPDYIQGYYYSKPCDREEFMAHYIA